MEKQAVIQNRYRLERRLGHEAGGATGVVYLATDLQLEQKVVVKMLRPVFASDREFIRELRGIFETIAIIKHPAIVRCRELIVSGGEIALVSDFVDGLTLEDALKKDGPFTPELSKQLLLQLCAAMHLAHSYGLGHYDLTRRNVMINKRGELLLCDFGISRPLKDWLLRSPGARKSSEFDRAQLIEYLAPEQRTDKPVYEIACDIYAAGILLYEMQTASLPDLSNEARRSARKREERASEAGALTAPDGRGPASWDYVVKKALSARPWQRWESFIVMSYALEGKLQAKTKPSEPPGSFVTPIKDRLFGKRIIGFVFVAILLLGAILGIAKLISMVPKDISGPKEALTEYLSEDARRTKKDVEAEATPQVPQPEVSAHLSTAKDLIIKGELDAAEREVQTARDLQADPTVGRELQEIIEGQRTINSSLEKARLHLKDSQLAEANVLLDQVLEMDPGNSDATDLKATIEKRQRIESLLKSARDAYDRKSYTTPEGESAYRFTQKVLEIDSQNQDAKSIIANIAVTYTRLGDTMFKAEEFGRAAFYYGKVLTIDAGNAYASERAKLSRQKQKEAQQAAKAEPEQKPAEPAPSPADPNEVAPASD
ncbi:MAG: protein kinase [Candidatus Coatesbacteria bacterium]|nr:protein kinase [Candidatus Coatesbacteria bacterium]